MPSERTPLLSSAGSSTLASPSTPTPSTPTTPTTPTAPKTPQSKFLAARSADTATLTPGGLGVGRQEERSRPLKESMSRARLVVILAGIWSSNFAFALQSTAIPTLAPTIASSFNHADLAAYLGSVFTLGNTAGIPVYGVLIDSLGRRFAMQTACALYGLGSVACALAPGMWPLVAGRALSGLGGGGLLTVSAVICTDLVALHERGFYQGLMMSIFGIGAALGGPTAGWLTDTYGWPLAFWSQLPIVIWCATIVTAFLPEPPIAPTHTSVWRGLASLDWSGSLLLLGSVSALILGLSFHTSYLRPWTDLSVSGLLAASAIGSVAFVANEAWVTRRGKNAVVPLSLFSTWQLCAIWASSALLCVASQAFLFHVPLYFAVMLGQPASQAGFVLSVCSGIGLGTGTLYAGYHIRRGWKYTWLGVVSLVPSIISAWVAASWQPGWPTWAYYATVLPPSAGYAVFLCVGLIALISSIDSRTMPKATALLYTVRSLGSTLGVSLGGSIQVGVLVRALRARFSDVRGGDKIIDAVVHSKAAIAGLPRRYARMALDAYAESLRAVWIVSGVVAVGTLVAALGVRQNEIRRKGQEAREGEMPGAREGEAGQP